MDDLFPVNWDEAPKGADTCTTDRDGTVAFWIGNPRRDDTKEKWLYGRKVRYLGLGESRDESPTWKESLRHRPILAAAEGKDEGE